MSAPKVLGTAPEPFDGSARKAEAFWSQLANYYYLNEASFPDESRRVSSALTHFKAGSPGGEWARDLTTEALKKPTPSFGTWADFEKAFKAQFIPVDAQLDATNKMHNTLQLRRPFNEWYQEWSSHAARANADDNTKMFAFRRNIIPSLNEKLIGVNPPPSTLDELVRLCRSFEQNFRLFGQNTNRGRRFQGATLDANDNSDPVELNYSGFPPGPPQPNQSTGPRPRLTPEERKRRFDNKLCLYCGRSGHFQKNCRAKKPGSQQRRNNFNKPGQNQPSARKIGAATIPDSPPGSTNTELPDHVTLGTLRTWYEEPPDCSRLEHDNPPRPTSAPVDIRPSYNSDF